MPKLINLRRIRKARGLTQKELAEKADVTESFISQCEKGSKSPSFEVALKLAEALDCESADLVSERTGLLDAIDKGNKKIHSAENSEMEIDEYAEFSEELQILMDNPETRTLLQAGRHLKPRQIKHIAEMMKSFTEGEEYAD